MLQTLANGIIVGGVYALISIGFALIFSSVRFYHLAYGGVALVGAYINFWLMSAFEMPFYASVFIASLGVGILGTLLWHGVYEPLQKRGASNVAILVASFGVMMIVQNILAIVFGNATKSVSLTDTIIPAKEFFGIYITFNQIIILVTTVVIVVCFEYILLRTKLGIAIRAVGQNAMLALFVGIQSKKIIVYSFFLGSFLSAIGVCLYSLEYGIKPIYGLHIVLKIVVACVIGGMGSIRGAMVGGVILGVCEQFGIYVFGGQWQETTAFVLLTLFLLWKPEGLFASQQRLT